MDVIEFGTMAYPFDNYVSMMLGGLELDKLRLDVAAPLPRERDQSTVWHEWFYDKWSRLKFIQEAYKRLVEEVCAPYIILYGRHDPFSDRGVHGDCPFYFQAIPTFRVSAPGSVGVGEFHRDRDYGHPNGEINFWMPLTKAFGTNTVWVEGEYTLEPVELNFGQIAVFDAVNLLHGNYTNMTEQSRVSIDFRLIPSCRIPKEPKRSINQSLAFVPGEYYAEEPIGLGTGIG